MPTAIVRGNSVSFFLWRAVLGSSNRYHLCFTLGQPQLPGSGHLGTQRQNTGPTSGLSIKMFSYHISGSNVALIVITISQDILFCLQLPVKIRDARLEQLNYILPKLLANTFPAPQLCCKDPSQLSPCWALIKGQGQMSLFIVEELKSQ